MRRYGLLQIVIINALCLSANAYALNSYFCSKTNNYIQVGDTMNQVFAKCGAPLSSKDVQNAPTVPTQVTQWIYNYQNNSFIRTGQNTVQNSALIVNMVNNKVISILVNGQNVQTTKFCSANLPISIGDSNLYIRQLCNTPSQMQVVTQNIQQPQTTQTIWTYQQQQFSPAVTLTFENNVLTSMN